jgi:uncharacterized protein (DUF983 family)
VVQGTPSLQEAPRRRGGMGLLRLLRPVVAGLLLRCPRCRRGSLGEGLFGTRQACGACGQAFAAGWGDSTGTMMLAQFLYGAFGLFGWFAVWGLSPPQPAWVVAGWIALFGGVLPLLTYRNLRGLWLGILEAGKDVFEAGADQD